MLLAIDTATNVPGIALCAAHGILGETTWHTREHHTRSLMPEIVRLLQLLDANMQEVRAIAVSTGPGSFTGLRIGLSAAKGLAYSLNAALLGVPTLDVTASACALQNLPVCAVLRAGRGRYGATMYHINAGTPARASEYLFGSAETLAPQIAAAARGPFVLNGEMEEDFVTALRAHVGERIVIAPRAFQIRRAGFLAELAWQRWQAGERDTIESLAPYYIPTAALA